MGWMGDISVPIISAEGNWSAKSLYRLSLRMKGDAGLYIAHIPVPVPTSITLYKLVSGLTPYLPFSSGCQESKFTCGLDPIGAKKSSLSSNKVNIW